MTSSQYSDAFVKVNFQEEREGDPGLEPWTKLGAQPHQGTIVNMKVALEKQYPNHSVVMSNDYRLNVLAMPGIIVQPVSTSDLVLNTVFIPLARNHNDIPGALIQSVEYGGFKIAWKSYDFILYTVRFPMGFGTYIQHYILHEGPAQPSHALLLEAFLYQDKLHNEIWVFNQGYWNKDANLWQAIQSADWKDVILEEDFKKQVKKDIYGFFESEKLYKDYGLPWKRGLILHGPPGNGKTISIKVVMKECDAMGFSPMYVKSFHTYAGDEYGMQLVFGKARQNAPCVVILEDLDALINDSNRSFFLNELDGLSNNDGLLVIGSTNHFDRLDPGLSTRPSRFDRKYLFDDPNRNGRRLYVQYWQDKLAGSKDIDFPDALAEKIADNTDRFSFAYLKEVFVSGLVSTMTRRQDGEDVSFAKCVMEEVDKLRKQLDKPDGKVEQVKVSSQHLKSSSAPPRTSPSGVPFWGNRFGGQQIEAKSEDSINQVSFQSLIDNISNVSTGPRSHDMGPFIPIEGHGPNDFRALIDRLAHSTDRFA